MIFLQKLKKFIFFISLNSRVTLPSSTDQPPGGGGARGKGWPCYAVTLQQGMHSTMLQYRRTTTCYQQCDKHIIERIVIRIYHTRYNKRQINNISMLQCTQCTPLKVNPDFCLSANMKQPVSTL